MTPVAGTGYHVGGGFLVDTSAKRPRVFVGFGARGLWFEEYGKVRAGYEDVLAVNFVPHDLRPFGGKLEQAIQLLDRSGQMTSISGVDRKHCGGGGDMRPGEPGADALQARGALPARDSLIDAGFEPVTEKGRGGIYRYMAGPNEILAVVRGGRIRGVFHASDIDPRFVGDISVQGVRRFTTFDSMRRNKVHYTGLGIAKRWIEYTLIPGTIADVYAARTRHLREPTNAEIGLRRVRVPSRGGFAVGGVNETATILAAREINGVSVNRLMGRMQPRATADSGFLGREENLLHLLARDNEVVRAAGLSHAAVAEPLRKVARLCELGFLHGSQSGESGTEIFLGGQPYRVQTLAWMGSVNSPFDDGTRGSCDFILYNPRTRARLRFPELLAEMSDRYGFYEGRNIRYRTAPEEIVSFFDHLRERAPRINEIAASVDARIPGRGHTSAPQRPLDLL